MSAGYVFGAIIFTVMLAFLFVPPLLDMIEHVQAWHTERKKRPGVPRSTPGR